MSDVTPPGADPKERMDTILDALAKSNRAAIANRRAITMLTHALVGVGLLIIIVLIHLGRQP